MEDFRVDVVVGKGPGATAIPLDVEPFTLVGGDDPVRAADRAAARPVRLRRPPGLLRAAPTSSELLRRSAGLLGVPIEPTGAAEIAGRSRGTPRIANRLLRRVRDYAEVRADGIVSPTDGPGRARGLRRRRARPGPAGPGGADARWSTGSAAGPVGLSTLAVAVGEQPDTVEEVCEPFLVRAGLLARTPRGRVATAAAWRHLGLAVPPPGRAAAGGGPRAPACSTCRS